MKKKKLEPGITFIDLFAGIGGMRIGFERNGGKCVFSSEIDESSQNMYECNFNEKPYGDIQKINATDIPDHDVLVAGFPCQAFSIIGDRLGFADTRGTLFFEIERILKEKRPKAFLLENVKQLVSHNRGKTLKVILLKLKKLGYFVHYKILNGLDFGVPQKRERVILVGFQKNYPFHFPQGLKGNKKELSDILEPDNKVDKSYFLSSHMKTKFRKRVDINPFSPSIWHENKSGNIGIHPYSCALRAGASYSYLSVNGVRRLTSREMLRLQGFPDSFKIIGTYTQIRRQAGNSVVVPKIQAVACEIVKSLSCIPLKPTLQYALFDEGEEERVYAY